MGINTDKPDEALTVHGSIQVTGALLQTSDARAKRNIQRVSKLRIVALTSLEQAKNSGTNFTCQ